MADATEPSNICDYCGQQCDGGALANVLACTFGKCDDAVYHQECLYTFLRANKLEKNRKTGFKCPRGCGKGSAHPSPCPGRIDKSHPYIPRNEEKFKKRQACAAELPPKPTKPKQDKQQEKAAAKAKAEADKAAAAKSREEATAKAKINGSANQPVPARVLASQVGTRPTKSEKSAPDMQQAALLAAAARKELNLGRQGSGALAHGNGTPVRDRPDPGAAAQRVGSTAASGAAWGTRAAGGSTTSAMHSGPGSSTESDDGPPHPVQSFTLGQIMQVATRKDKNPAKAAAAVLAAAAAAATAVHHSHTGSENSFAGQELPEIGNLEQFPPVAATLPPAPPTPAGKPPMPWIPTPSPAPTVASPQSQHRHRLSDASSHGTVTPPVVPSTGSPPAEGETVADASAIEADDDEEGPDGAGAGGKGLSKAQRKNLKRAEKKKRQVSMTILEAEAEAEAQAVAESLRLQLELEAAQEQRQAQAQAAAQASPLAQVTVPPVAAPAAAATRAAVATPPAKGPPPGLPPREAIATAESPAAPRPPPPAPSHQVANADHLLDDQNSPPAPPPDDDPLHLIRQHQQEQHEQALYQQRIRQAQQQLQSPRQPPPGYVSPAAGGADDVPGGWPGPPPPPPPRGRMPPPGMPQLEVSQSSLATHDTLLEDRCVAALVTHKCRSLYSQLLQLSFCSWQAAGAVQACGATSHRAVQWLLERMRCGPQQLLAAAAAGATPEVDISGELAELAAAQNWLQLRAEALYQTVIDTSGDVHAALSLLAQQQQHYQQQQHGGPSQLQPAHSMETFYSAQSELPTPLSRLQTGRSDHRTEAPWLMGVTDSVTSMTAPMFSANGADSMLSMPQSAPSHCAEPASQFHVEKSPSQAHTDMWQGRAAVGGRWSIDVVVNGGMQGSTARRSFDEMLSGQTNGDYGTQQHMGGASGYGMWRVSGSGGGGGGGSVHGGVHGSTGAAWESHGSTGTTESRPHANGSRGHGSQAEEAEVNALMALMCR